MNAADLQTQQSVASLVARAEALVRAGRHEEAVAAYAEAGRSLDGNSLDGPNLDGRSLGNHGGLLLDLRRFDEAVQVLTLAAARAPTRPAVWHNLGLALIEQQRYDDAIAALANALRLRPTHASTLASIGVALNRRRAYAEALTFFDLAAANGERSAQLSFNRAFALLASGRFTEGFEAFEARHALNPVRYPGTPRWDGSPLAGRTLLVHDEQGLGDVVQFARFLPVAAAAASRGGRVVLSVPRSLTDLLAGLDGADEVVDSAGPLPPHDLVCPLMSLARLARTTPDIIPAAGGYLKADPQRAASWRRRLAGDVAGDMAGGMAGGMADDRPDTGGGSGVLRVGLVWAGGRRDWHRECTLMDGRRSLRLDALAPLARAVPEAEFYSLQIGEAAAEAARPPPGMRLFDHTGQISDFADTAALIAELDLVISVDTSTAHLAGALGRPVWMLSRFDRCWRWGLAETTTPWYHSMRLYAQPSPGDWAAPVEAVAADLRRFADQRSRPFNRATTSVSIGT